jgi:hypothetical protein
MFPAAITNLPLLYNDSNSGRFFEGFSNRGERHPSYEFNDSDDSGSDCDISIESTPASCCQNWYKNKKLWPFISVGVGAVFGIMFAAGSSAIGTGAAASAVATWVSVNIGLTVGIVAAGALAGAGIGLGVLALGLAICALRRCCKKRSSYVFNPISRGGRLSTISEGSCEDPFSTDNSPFRNSWAEVHHKVLKHGGAANFNRVSENYFSPTAVDL